VQVDVFNSLGIRLYHEDAHRAGDGVQLSHLWKTPGVYYVEVRTGADKEILKCSGEHSFEICIETSEATMPPYAKSSAGYTLQVEKSGYATKQVPVTSLTAPVGTIKLHSAATTLFFDDFTGSSIDASKWNVMNRISDQVNGELDGCIPANVRVSGGLLMLDQKHEDVTIGDAIEAPKLMHYTTGHVQQKTAPFLYGTIEVRAKISGGIGLWPCIWMLGYQWQASQPSTANTPGHNWPHDGWCEVDIGEFWQNERNAVSNGCHWQTGDGIHLAALPFNATSRFMVYRLQWSAGSMVYSVDGEDGAGFRTLRTITGSGSVPNVPMYVILSCPVGGLGGGTPDPATLPQTMSIDWVRVTQ
jgi:beta-glucanase (GH16 family)